MFRDAYIKDNELIRPDEDFLKRLKENMGSDVVHIGDYIDYDNADSFEKIGKAHAILAETENKKGRGAAWRPFAVLAACFVLVCTIAFAANRTGFLSGEGLQAGMELAIPEKMNTIEGASDLSEECIAQYDEVCALLAMNDGVIVFEMESFVQEDNGVESIDKLKNQSRELEKSESDDLVSDILDEKYSLTDTVEGFDSVTYYLAEVDEQSCVIFGLDSKQFICIMEVFEK